MVSKNQPDWLPSDWKLQIKVKNGRKFKCYVHSKTSQKVYSRLAVLRCTKNGSVANDNVATQQSAKKNSQEQETQSMVDSLKGLPAGWTVEVKSRQSGTKKGTPYKCYIELSSGSKFYSKPEVYRHLQSTKNSAGPSRQEERRATRHSSSNRPVDQPKALEFDVEPTVSTRSSKTTASRRDSSLKTEPNVSENSKPTTRSSARKQPNASQISETTASWRLSPGKKESNLSENSKTTSSKRRSAEEKEPNVSPNPNTTPRTRLSLLRNKPNAELNANMAPRTRLSLERIKPNVSLNPNTSPHIRVTRHSLKREEPNVSPNPNTTPCTRLSSEKNEKNVSSNPNATPRMRLSVERKKPNVSLGPNTTPCTRLSLERKEPNVSANPNTIPRTRVSLERKEPNVSPIPNLTPRTGLSLEIQEPNASPDPISTPATSLSSETKEQNVSPNPEATQASPSTTRKSSAKKKVVVENTVDKDLPSGWIKEMRKRFSGTQEVRTDPFYFHPASGLVFRSKLEVLRYLDTGEISRHAYWRKNYVDKEELASEKKTPTPSEKRVTKANRKPQNEFSGDKTSTGNPSLTPESEALKETSVRKITRSSSRVGPASVGEVKPNQSSLSPKGEDDKGKLRNSSSSAIELPSTSAMNASTSTNTLSVPIKGCSNKKVQTSKRKSTDQNLVTLPARSSKRLAGVDVQAVFHSIPIELAHRAAIKKPITAKITPELANTFTGVQGQPKQPVPQEAQHCPLIVSTEMVLATEDPSKTSDTLTQDTPSLVSEVEVADVPLTNTERPSENSADHPVQDLKPGALVPKEQSCSKVQQSESEFSFPPPLWSDPCLEFAYKTLTGAIPLDDNLAIEDYIQYQLHTSKPSSEFQTLPDIDMATFPQNDETKLVAPSPEGTKLPNGNGLAPTNRTGEE